MPPPIPINVAKLAHVTKQAGKQSPGGSPAQVRNIVAAAAATTQKGPVKGQEDTTKTKTAETETAKSDAPPAAKKDPAAAETTAPKEEAASVFRTIKAVQRFKSASSDHSFHAPQEIADKLLTLCKRGDWGGAEETVDIEAPKHGIDLEMRSEATNWSPLHYAAKDNQARVTEKLLDLGFDINAQSADGVTPLHLACAFAREDTVRVLLSRHADTLIPGGAKKHLPIHILSAKPTNAAVGIMQLIINSSPRDVKLLQDGEGNIPLHLSVDTDNYPIMGLLLTDQLRSQLAAMRPPKGDTVLHVALRKKEFDMIRMLVDLGADVNHKNDEGQTVVHLSAEMGEERLLKYFCSRGGDPNLFDNNDQTAVSLATKNGHIKMVELLTDRYGASVSHRSKDGSTLLHLASDTVNGDAALIFMRKGVPIHMPNKTGAKCIHMAAFRGHTNIVTELIKSGEKVDCRNNDGFTALHLAVQGGQAQVVETLLGLGADVNLQAGKDRESALHLAAKSPNGDKCSDILIRSGANVNAMDAQGELPLHEAARHGSVETTTLLLRDGSDTTLQSTCGETVLHVAVHESHFYVAKAILDHVLAVKGKEAAKVLVNQQNKKGEATVHYATELTESGSHFTNEDKDIMHMLLKKGGDVNLESFDKKETPIHYCSRSGNTNVLQEMISQFGDMEGSVVCNKPAKYGWTPLFYACYHGHPEVIKILINQNARIDVFDENGEAPLHTAVEHGHEDVVDILLENNAFVNVRNKSGLTPLHLACKLGYNSMVKQLITEHGALMDAMTLTKQTPLHLAALSGQMEVCRTLLSMKADMNAIDNFSQTPLHLAAENDHADVLKMFLEARAELLSVPNKSGYTCAHIAATKGSLTVIKELMKFNRDVVISARVKKTGSTTLHLAAEGGHAEIVKLLLQQGSKAADENSEGYTALHMAAKHGHIKVLHAIKTAVDWKICSRKTGLTALHVAAASGQADFAGEMLRYRVPAGIRSERPGNNPKGDHGITPLHLACKYGHENVVRMLLNSAGVQVDAPTEVNGTIPMHLAAEGGHLLVAGLLISRSTEGLLKADKHGRTVLHLAAAKGHRDMASLILGQGAQINSQDNRGWTPLHYSSRHGYIEVVKLLVESGADPTMTSKDGKVPLCCAAGAGHQEVLSYLLKKEHDTFELMDDKNFLIDLMVCAKQHNNRPVQEYILVSAAPIDTAVKLAKCFENLTEKEKDRAKDLVLASEFCDTIATDLLSLAAAAASAGALLRAVDHKQTEFLDVLLELERKEVVSQHSVQKYLSGVWMGNLTWAGWKFLVLFAAFLVCPIVWVAVSCPIGHNLAKVPVIKFMSYLVSHVFFIALLILTTINPWIPLWSSHHLIPHIHEWGLYIWLIGIIVSDITNPTDRAGLGGIKVVVIWFGLLGVISHIAGFIFDEEESRLVMLYIRNQFLAVSLLLSFVEFLNFLTFHHLFGPWAVIIRDLIKDLLRFLAILGIFMCGFSLHVSTIYVPVFKPPENENSTVPSVGLEFQSPLFSFEMLFFSLFGLVEPDYMPPMHFSPPFAKIIMKLVFAIYMMVTVVVLINLLIAMMSNTYSRIEAQSDTEWKFGRAKLIRNMIRTSPTPSPLIIFVGLPIIFWQKFKDKRARERGDKMAIHALSRRASVSTAASKAASAWVTGPTGPASSRGSHATLTPSFGGGTQMSGEGTVSGEEAKKISEVVNWKSIVKKYWEFIGVASRGEDDEGGGEGGEATGEQGHTTTDQSPSGGATSAD